VSFLKFSRDRRGYEHFYLVEPVTGRRGKTRQRVLYWFRTPPNVKIGREPFDAQVMRALETRYPGVRFDWDQLRHTPIPSAEPEYWRERRRAERAVRRQEDEEAETMAAEPPAPERGVPDRVPPELPEPPTTNHGPEIPAGSQSAVDTSEGAPAGVGREGPGSRRRRRRRRGQRSPASSGAAASGEPSQTESSAGASIDADEVTEDGPGSDD
jgi:hypothetical protein